MFDWFKAAAAAGFCKMRLISNLGSGRSTLSFAEIQLIFCTCTYLGRSRRAVQNLGLNAQDSALFAHFSNSIEVIRTKLGRDIARSKEHLVREFNLK